MTIFDAIATRDASLIIGVVDKAAKAAAREASARAHALGIEVADGRVEQAPTEVSREIRRHITYGGDADK